MNRLVGLPTNVDHRWPFGGMRPFSYDVIMADPPWRYENWSTAGEHKNASAKYECASIDALAALPVADLAAPSCILWMWATNPMLPQALELMRRWHFTFKTAGHWCKTTRHGKLAFGTGYILRSAGEPFLIGTIGEPTTAKNVRSVVEGPVREHSRKPDQAYAACEALAPTARRADLFSRQSRPGWDGWGNESGMFDDQKPGD